MKVLFDNNVPAPLARCLEGHDIRTAADMGWGRLANGNLLSRAEMQSFELMVTGDKNLTYQQNMTGRKIALIVLSAISWKLLKSKLEPIQAAVDQAEPGSYEYLEVGHPPKRRRPHLRNQS